MFQLLYRPRAAVSGIIDEGRTGFAVGIVLLAGILVSTLASGAVTTWLAQTGQLGDETRAPAFLAPLLELRFYSPLLLLALFYALPALLAVVLFTQQGSIRASFERDYATLLTCVLMSWSVVHLVLMAVLYPLSRAGAWPALAGLVVVAYAYLTFLFVTIVRTIFGTEYPAAIAAAFVSWAPFVGGLALYSEFSSVIRWLASPFLLYYAYLYFNHDVRFLGSNWRSRQNMRRYLEASAVNPHDADAQYQLGLVYQQRRQYGEAVERFQKAVEIDTGETDAHFQLGRILRDQGKLDDALAHFEAVRSQNPRHSRYEVLREIASVYLAKGRKSEARELLERYIEQREYDPEGLYYLGRAREATGARAEARHAFEQSIEAARTAPPYLRGSLAKWSRMSRKEMNRLKGY